MLKHTSRAIDTQAIDGCEELQYMDRARLNRKHMKEAEDER